MPHSLEEERVSDAALQFAKKHKKSIAQRLTNPEIYTPEDHPVSVFMAGSPGAGKTEASLELLAKFGSPILRIDADAPTTAAVTRQCFKLLSRCW